MYSADLIPKSLNSSILVSLHPESWIFISSQPERNFNYCYKKRWHFFWQTEWNYGLTSFKRSEQIVIRRRFIVVVQKRSVIPTFFSITTYAAIPYFGT